jgi:hypothetical protein
MVAGFVAFGNGMLSTPEQRQFDIAGRAKLSGAENCKELSPGKRSVGEEPTGLLR